MIEAIFNHNNSIPFPPINVLLRIDTSIHAIMTTPAMQYYPEYTNARIHEVGNKGYVQYPLLTYHALYGIYILRLRYTVMACYQGELSTSHWVLTNLREGHYTRISSI